ncbi:MAG: EAL domain-containing protein [bacterium]|nr:EAL domain-containing protein [bacterium]
MIVRWDLPRITGRRHTALAVVLFLATWIAVSHAGELLEHVQGAHPLYPALAVDVVALILLGWAWWPIVPAAALLNALLFDHRNPQGMLLVIAVQGALGAIFAAAVRVSRERARVSIPLRTLRDVAWFCGIVGIAAPLLFALVGTTILIGVGRVAADDALLEITRFLLGDVTAVIALVPMVVIFIGWRTYQPPAERVEPSLVEIALSVALTVGFTVGGMLLASATHEPVLDLSFVAMSWLAIRCGFRGAALGTMAAFASAALMHGVLGLPDVMLVQSEGFLISSSLMALLLAGLTNERWELLASLSRRAYVDDLTGLPNRERLVEWIESQRDAAVVLVIVDVDDMRVLNQGIGRAAADRILQEIALRMRTTFPFSHMVARVSADEFAVAVVDERSPHALMSELRTFFDAPFDRDGAHVFVSVSMGAVRTARVGSADEMLRRADVALDRAKLSPTRSIVYSPDLQKGSTLSLVTELHRALERGEFEPFFQPIFRYDHFERRWLVVGAEALLRWNHPERGILAPAEFIDLLERLSIAEQVGWQTMEQSLRRAGAWRAFVPEFRVWVNLFARQVLSRDCAPRVAALLERTAVSADALVIEINERVVASDERDVASLAADLRAIGVQSAIDDFGTGGSSLGRVRDVPAHVLKIDRSFVNRSEVDTKARAVAATVVRLGAELGMAVVAEGVENLMQLKVMQETGCDYVQGYALGHPLPAALFASTFFALEQTGS